MELTIGKDLLQELLPPLLQAQVPQLVSTSYCEFSLASSSRRCCDVCGLIFASFRWVYNPCN